MLSHNIEWAREHDRLAKKELAEIEKVLAKKAGSKNMLPQLPKEYLEWISQARPIVEGRPRDFLAAPFWEEIYNDDYSFKMIVGGRQIYKSTYITDILACEATSLLGTQVCYVTFDQGSLNSFSKQKLQIGTFSQNPILSKFPRHKLGNIGEISLKNGSTIYCTTDNYEYRHVEGKSLNHCILDEAQYQDIQFYPKIIQTMMATKGKLTILGLGGEAGSPYETLWEQTDQREWTYDDPRWREKLQFGQREDGTSGLIIGPYLKQVLRGRWVPQKPENKMCHGYHIPQTIFPTIPLTISDAIDKYNIHPMYSIEYQQKNNPASVFDSHTMGKFYKATRRPVTREMVLACMTPYRYLGLISPREIAELKETFQNKVKISMGVDFGSGNPSSTVISILLEWRKTKPTRYQLAFLEKRPSENQLDQAEYINTIFREARCDVGVGDLGYGANQIKLIQDGGRNRTAGQPFSGVGSGRFVGCRTISDETKPLQRHDSSVDEHGEEVGRFSIDKTTKIQEFIDMLAVYIPHEGRPLEKNLRRPRLMIPFLTEREYDTDWLIDDFTNITRKDLRKTQDVTLADPRQKARKEFNHPKDSVMSIIYAKVGLEFETDWHWVNV